MNKLVKKWMTSPITTITADTRLSEARKIIADKNIHALPVMKDDKLTGIITRRGLLRLDLSTLANEAWNTKVDIKDEKVGDVMTVSPLTILSESLIAKAARIMLENKITTLPVMENKKLVGILTNYDILKFLLSEYSEVKKPVYISSYMTDEVITIDKNASLLEAHSLMGTKRIRSLPVMENDQMIGLVTRTDLMSSDPSRLVSRNNQMLSLQILTQDVEKIMSSPVITVNAREEINIAAKLMLEHKIHVLPVVDEEKKMVGIITESDLFLFVVRKFYS